MLLDAVMQEDEENEINSSMQIRHKKYKTEKLGVNEKGPAVGQNTK